MAKQSGSGILKSGIIIIITVVVAVVIAGAVSFVIASVNGVSTEERAAIHLNLVQIHLSKGDVATAFSEIDKAVEIYPEYDLAYSVLGDIYLGFNNLDMALGSYIKAAEINQDPEHYYDIGNVYYRAGNLEDALTAYMKVVELSPNASNAYLAIGNLLSDLGRYDQAKQYYDKTLELNYNNANAHNDFGAYLEVVGDLENARQQYKIALELDPNHELALQNLNRIGGE